MVHHRNRKRSTGDEVQEFDHGINSHHGAETFSRNAIRRAFWPPVDSQEGLVESVDS
jgi:hypothetical protein